MKLIHLTLLLLSALVLNGCIDEDLSSCYDCDKDNLLLDFLYTDKEGADIFADNIQGVDVFVYDSNDFFVKQHYVTKSELSVYAGTELSLLPGTYRLVCWANVAEKTSITEPTKGTPYSDAILDFATTKEGDAVTTGGDPLYYAPKVEDSSSSKTFTVTVPEKGTHKATISFRSAHMVIELYVKGFEDNSLLPLIELSGVPAGYNFDLQTFGPSVTYSGVATNQTIDGQQMAVVKFITPLFDRDTPIKVHIKKQSDGSTLTTVSLDDFISDNNIIISNITQVVIPIYVEYMQTSVDITLPAWRSIPVWPEIN